MIKLKYHKDLTLEKWSHFPFYKQILMIATELQRASSWIKKKDYNEVNLCYERALELIYLTIGYLTEISKNKDNRLKELLRFKECLLQEYINKDKSLENNELLFFTLISLSSESYCLLNP